MEPPVATLRALEQLADAIRWSRKAKQATLQGLKKVQFFLCQIQILIYLSKVKPNFVAGKSPLGGGEQDGAEFNLATQSSTRPPRVQSGHPPSSRRAVASGRTLQGQRQAGPAVGEFIADSFGQY